MTEKVKVNPICKHAYEDFRTLGKGTLDYYLGQKVESQGAVILFAVYSGWMMTRHRQQGEGPQNVAMIVYKIGTKLYMATSGRLLDVGLLTTLETTATALRMLLEKHKVDKSHVIYWWESQFREFLDELEGVKKEAAFTPEKAVA